jgi:hypothetical protein
VALSLKWLLKVIRAEFVAMKFKLIGISIVAGLSILAASCSSGDSKSAPTSSTVSGGGTQRDGSNSSEDPKGVDSNLIGVFGKAKLDENGNPIVTLPDGSPASSTTLPLYEVPALLPQCSARDGGSDKDFVIQLYRNCLVRYDELGQVDAGGFASYFDPKTGQLLSPKQDLVNYFNDPAQVPERACMMNNACPIGSTVKIPEGFSGLSCKALRDSTKSVVAGIKQRVDAICVNAK